MRCLLLALALSGCGLFRHHEAAKDPTPGTPGGVLEKAALYMAHAPEARDEAGFYHDGCDKVGFTALHDAATGCTEAEAVLKAQGESGRWYRDASHTCYDQDRSASDISEDMLLMILGWAWQCDHRDVVLGIIDYGKKHAWVMGRGDPFRTAMRPPLILSYYYTAKAMGKDLGVPPVTVGKEQPEEQKLSLTAATGYEAHLQVLHALFDAAVLGGASDSEKSTLRTQAERQPENALFQAAWHLYSDGDQRSTWNTLEEASLFPPAMLPAPKDRCEEYLFQRDDDRSKGGDWTPCAGVKPHSGTDYLFTLLVANNRFRKK